MISHTGGRSIFKSRSVLRSCIRRAVSTAEYDGVEIKELVKCRNEKEVYLVLVDEKMVNPCWDLPKIVVLGAGIAGLSAAQALVSAGFNDVTVLEAADGPGGRILSYDMRSFPIDLGATHIEGATPMNSAFNLACQEGLLMKSSLLTSNPYMGTFMTSSGAVLPPSIESSVHYAFSTIENEASYYYRNTKESPESLGEFIRRRIEEEIVLFPELYRGLATRALIGRMNELRGYWGTDLDVMAVDQYGSFYKIPGCDLRIPSGMIGIVAPLLRDMPDYSVRYCKPVKFIKWKTPECREKDPKKKDEEKCENRAVTVVTSDGSTYPADYIIVTCSLGYLKKHHPTMFVPPLPKEKTNAIENLGWGHICNIYMLYTEPFWVWKEGVVRLAWGAEELKNKGNWLKGVGSISEVLSSVQMLMVKVGGEEAKHVETLSPTRIAEDLTRLIRCFTGDSTLPYPFLVIPSKWSSNEWVLGAKAHIPLGSSASDICTLADPVPSCGAETPVVLFAGEATSSKYHGTIHGARMSGIREADRIIKLTHKFQGRPRKEVAPACSTELTELCA